MVRLKESQSLAGQWNRDLFQFHSGSIKRSVPTSCFAFLIVFQFHSGSIKSVHQKPQRITANSMFQFHSGSIKSKRPYLLSQGGGTSFNSIVVRLKGGWCGGDSKSTVSFQFHSGSIKRKTQWRPLSSTLKFQFHSGSIKSWLVAFADGDEQVSIP